MVNRWIRMRWLGRGLVGQGPRTGNRLLSDSCYFLVGVYGSEAALRIGAVFPAGTLSSASRSTRKC